MKGARSTIKRLDPGAPRYMLGVRDERRMGTKPPPIKAVETGVSP
jgi:hypothetical protein